MKRALLALLVAIGLTATATTIASASYAGTCAKLAGFPRLLQRVGFVAPGPCDAKPKGNACAGGACTTADRKPGKCRNIALSGAVNCACVANTVSPGVR